MLHTYTPFDGAGHILLPLLSPYTLVETTKAIWTMNMNDRTDRMGDQVDGCAMLKGFFCKRMIGGKFVQYPKVDPQNCVREYKTIVPFIY